MGSERQRLEEALAWCARILGPCRLVEDHSRSHPDRQVGALKLAVGDDEVYLKLHTSASGWAREVHAYERWAQALGHRAPRLVAVSDEAPGALIITALPGSPLEGMAPDAKRDAEIWRAAGTSLRALHGLASGTFFGACTREGLCAGEENPNAARHVGQEIVSLCREGIDKGYLSAPERALADHALSLLPAFEGRAPVPCHRDYCPANWLVTRSGALSGVIDYEFSGWDVLEADLARDPEWTWMTRPALTEALLAGYGQPRSGESEARLFVARVAYALGAIVWGSNNDYHGFAAEGRGALEHLRGAAIQWPPL